MADLTYFYEQAKLLYPERFESTLPRKARRKAGNRNKLKIGGYRQR
jgi:hypothetical protein